MVKRLVSTPPVPLVEGGYALRILHTVGRRSGQVRSTAVGVLQRNGNSYLVCPDRTRDWPRNLVADQTCLIQAGTERAPFAAIPVEGGEAVDTIGAYLAVVQVPWARRAFGLGENPGREQIGAALSRMAVFRLEPGTNEGAA